MNASAKPSSRIETLDAALLRLAAVSKSRPVRTIQEFAEQEIILPDDGGQFGKQKFRVDRQPWVELLWKELDSGDWLEAWITGCVQSGKTLIGFVIPLIYMIVELRKGPIAAIPDGTMVGDKWNRDIEPVFRANPEMALLLPTKGPGSKGGTPKNLVTLTNGLPIKFATKGGSDQSKAGYTAPFICLTEAAGWSRGTATSEEGRPIDQIRGRQASAKKYNEDGSAAGNSMLVAEGTVTNNESLPLSEFPNTTQSRIACPCPHCNEFVTPEREHLRGWKGCKTKGEAIRNSHFVCPSCEHKLTTEDRVEMNQNAVLLHLGQKMVDGEIVGDVPDVDALGFRYNAFNNLFLNAAEYGASEWLASQLEHESELWINAEKTICQQQWAIGFVPPNIARSRLSLQAVKQRKSKLVDRIVPRNCIYLVPGVDVGKYKCWYVTLAFCDDGTAHVVAHGAVDTSLKFGEKIPKEHEAIAIARTLDEINDMCQTGWAIDGGGIKSADLVLTDCGWRPDAVFAAISKRDKARFKAVRGRGKTVWHESDPTADYVAPSRLTQVVREFYGDAPMHREYVRRWGQDKIVVDADYAKTQVQDCFRIQKGMPGSITLPNVVPQVVNTLAKHVCAELKDADGNWVKRGANHLLDSMGYAWMGGLLMGWNVLDYKHLVPLVAPVEEKRSLLMEAMKNARR